MIYVILYLMLALIVSFLLYIAIPFLYARHLKRRLRLLPELQNKIVITLDDGPGMSITPAILKLLRTYDVKASFFLLGKNIKGKEHVVRQIASENHEICSHGFNHLHYWKCSPFRSVSDINKGFKAINAALNIEKEKYGFRPPYGKLNLFTLIYLWIRKIPIYFWTHDSQDTWLPIENQDSNLPAMLAKQKGGGIILLAHDFDRDNKKANQFVLEMLENILSTAKENNIQIVPLSNLNLEAGK